MKKLNIVSIDCVCGAMLYPPPEVSDVGKRDYVEELILSVETAEPPATPPAGSGPPATPPAGSGPPATPPAGSGPPATPPAKPDDVVQRRVSELSAKAANVQTQTTTETVTVDTPDGPVRITITKAKIIARRYMSTQKQDGLYCPRCGRNVVTITWPS
jgi:hypothetical protein